MTRTLAAFAALAFLGVSATAQQVRTVVVPQGTGAPALGQLGSMIQGGLTTGVSAPGVSLSRGGITAPQTVVQAAPSALLLPNSAVVQGGRRIAIAQGSVLQTLPQGAGAQKLMILMERAAQASSIAQAAAPQAAQTPAGARAVMARVAAELETMSAERLRSMPLEDLNAWSARLLEGAPERAAADTSAPQTGTSRSFKNSVADLHRAAAPAAEPEPAVPAPKPALKGSPEPPVPGEEPPVPAEAKRTIKGFTLARIFSISVFALHQIAFATMAIGAVGRDQFATVMLVSGLASIPLAFLNGMLVDRLTPRQILIGGSALLAIASLAMAGLNAAGMITFGTLVPLSIITQFMLIAVIVGEASLIPKILKDAPQAIPRTFALFDLIFAGLSAAASVIGGILVKSYLGYTGTFLVYAAVQGLIVIPIYLRFMPKVQEAANKAAAGFGDALALLRKSPYLLGLLGLSFAAVLLVFPLRITLLPVIINSFLHGTAVQQGFINTAVFLGMLGASVFNLTLAKKVTNSRLLIGSALAFAGFGVLLAMPSSITAMFAGISLIYFLQTISENVLRGLYSQEAGKLHPEFVGRLMGIRSAMFGAAISAGTWLVKEAITGAAYPALLWKIAPAYGAAIALYLAAPWILKWVYRKTHPGTELPKELN
ncbi:MAG: MFS transporter [Elusimicrobia bacterium]|nr:MFS transporter [Elusimicrobiota bacterium]